MEFLYFLSQSMLWFALFIQIHPRIGLLQEFFAYSRVLPGEERAREQGEARLWQQGLSGGKGSGRALPLHPGTSLGSSYNDPQISQ